jgi:cell division protein FtsZ
VPGLINLDFADVRTVMAEAGSALIGIGVGSGEGRASSAASAAISSPLLETSMDGARGVLMNITGGTDLAIHEVNEAAVVVQKAADPDANIIFGAVIDERMDGEVRITVIATGFEAKPQEVDEAEPAAVGASPTPQREGGRFSLDDLDIPAFLRRR